MTFADYIALPAVNISTLLYMLRSPLHYRQALEGGYKDTPAKRLGRIIHLAVLEPERYSSSIAIWDGGRRAGKEWTAWHEANTSREQVTAEEHDLCRAVSDAIHSHPVAVSYLSRKMALTEHTLTWRRTDGIDCKARLDWCHPADGIVVDLKTTRDASEFAFGRSAASYQYHTRAAFYADAFAASYGSRPEFVFVAVEKEPPYAVAVYTVGDDILDAGRRVYEPLLEQLSKCRADNEWPGIAGGKATELLMPEWVFRTSAAFDLMLDGEAVSL